MRERLMEKINEKMDRANLIQNQKNELLDERAQTRKIIEEQKREL